MMKKKIISIVITLCLLVGLIPDFTFTASAAGVTTRTTTLDLTSTALSYSATDTTTKTANAVTTNITDSAEGWSWDAVSKILTLSGVDFNTATGYGIKVIGNTTIVLATGSVNMVKAGGAVGIDNDVNGALQKQVEKFS